VDPRLLDRSEQVPASDTEPFFLPVDIDFPQSPLTNLHDQSLFQLDAGAIQNAPSAAAASHQSCNVDEDVDFSVSIGDRYPPAILSCDKH
jgi:hypothetical protein